MERALRLAGIIGAIVLVLLIVGFVLAAVFNVLLDVLYIFLIILAAFTLFATALLIYSVLLLIQTIVTVRDEMKPLLVSVNQTADYLKDTAKTAEQTVTTIGSTAQLTSEFALGPTIRTTAAILAGQQMLRVFLGRGRVRKRAEERRRQQREAMQASVGGGD